MIRPIERMISIVESLAINPFSHSVARRNEKVRIGRYASLVADRLSPCCCRRASAS